jgi:cell division septum initiation protein DivIVA
MTEITDEIDQKFDQLNNLIDRVDAILEETVAENLELRRQNADLEKELAMATALVDKYRREHE